MKFFLVLAILVLVIPCIAEKVAVGNHTIEFNISAPYKTIVDDSLLEIKTFDGWTQIYTNVPKSDLVECMLLTCNP
jgi:hypothetical protein